VQGNAVNDMEPLMLKMFGMFESFTSKIISQMNFNFEKQNSLMASEMFAMQTRLDCLEKENMKLRKDNEDLRKGQETVKGKIAQVETSNDNNEQQKIKDDVIVTGEFEAEPVNPAKFSNIMKEKYNLDIDPLKISKISSFKNKNGQTVVRLTTFDIGTKISLFKNKKNLAQQKVYVSEALTATKFHLLMTAKHLCKNKDLFSTWSRNGNIYIKKTEQGIPQLIRDRAHLDIFVHATV
jgi:hypothetical protein